jgi:FtsH-binding integral membrane protein
MFTPLTMLTYCVLYLSVITGLTLYLSNVDKQVNFKTALITSGFSILMGGILMLVFYEITFIKFLICGVLVAFASTYLIYATTLIFESKRKSIKMDDETMGVISYYSDFFSVGKHLFQRDYS